MAAAGAMLRIQLVDDSGNVIKGDWEEDKPGRVTPMEWTAEYDTLADAAAAFTDLCLLADAIDEDDAEGAAEVLTDIFAEEEEEEEDE